MNVVLMIESREGLWQDGYSQLSTQFEGMKFNDGHVSQLFCSGKECPFRVSCGRFCCPA